MFCGRYQILDSNDSTLHTLEQNDEDNNQNEENEEDQSEEDEEEYEEVEEEEKEEEGNFDAEQNDDNENSLEKYDTDETYKISDLELALKEDNDTFGDEDNNFNKSNSTTSKKELIPLPDLNNIEENSVAQLLLKKILNLQTTIENQEVSDGNTNIDTIDQTFWEKIQSNNSENNNEEYFPFALTLTESLFSSSNDDSDEKEGHNNATPIPTPTEIITNWIQRNRPSFILSDILKVPSARSTLLKLLKPFKKQIKTLSKKLAGAKHLLEQIEKK